PDVPTVYRLNFDALKNLEGFGAKSIHNLHSAIEASKQQPLHRLIYGLGIRYVGETTAKTLAQSVSNIFEFEQYSIEQLQQLPDVGIKVAASIHSFFNNQDNIQLLHQLKKLGLQLEAGKKEMLEGNLNAQTFLFTGTLVQLKRSDAEAMVESNGGNIVSGVSSKLNYLVVGADAGSKLEKAKKIPSIKILSEEEFIKMLST
ncbi:MAG: helix-hairpin-helix domain-containing protein, partial [Ferruginibacter sp.]